MKIGNSLSIIQYLEARKPIKLNKIEAKLDLRICHRWIRIKLNLKRTSWVQLLPRNTNLTMWDLKLLPILKAIILKISILNRAISLRKLNKFTLRNFKKKLKKPFVKLILMRKAVWTLMNSINVSSIWVTYLTLTPRIKMPTLRRKITLTRTL